MQFKIELFIREHRSGFFTLSVVGTPRLSVFTASIEAGKQDLALAIGDRIERTHPSYQADLFSLGADRREEVIVPDLLPVLGEGEPSRAAMKFSVLLGDNRAFTGLWAPRPDLHLWIARKEVDWEEAARELLAKTIGRKNADQMLALRFEKREWTESLSIEAEPPPLTRFVGKNRNLSELPPLGPKEEKDEQEAKKKKPDTPTLRTIGVHLSKLAEENELEHAHERKRELDDLLRMIAAPGEKAIAVIGPSGVGKSTILSELVYRLRAPDAPAKLKERPVWFADASRLIAGQGWFGDWQRQCLDAIAECEAAEVIWYIGPLLPLLDAGKSINSDQNVAQLLKPYLTAKRITVIGECTAKDFAKLELREGGFARAFQAYRLAEPDAAESHKILEKVGAELSELESLEITRDGLNAIFELCKRYVSDGSHLGAAIHFLRRTAELMSAKNSPKIGRHEAVAAFSAETGLPEKLVRDDLPLDPEDVRAAFRGRLIGQDEAIRRMTDLIAVIKAGLSDLSRPLGSFLFVGPTGVGKTETAKALASYLFGGEHRLARFDMSEYVGWDAVHRFLGDARTEGKLVEAIRRRPFSVVLLDEIEKAHPAIFDVLLQVLGEARLTDESGRIADFRNAVIIMTSNLGAETFKTRAGFAAADNNELRLHFVKEAERFFRPELFNRIDHLVPFAPLDQRSIEEITRRELSKLLEREGLRRRDLTLELDDDVLSWLAQHGVESKYGARPLKRTLERALAIPLARQISKTKSGEHARIAVKTAGEELIFEPKEKGAAEAASGETLAKIIEKIDGSVFRLQRWQETDEYNDLVQEIRLLDQLAQSRQFWANREAAEARMAGTGAARELLEGWTNLEAQLGGLQDLAYEAHHTRDLSPKVLLEEEHKKLTTSLIELELRLYERRFPTPSRAVLYFVPMKNSGAFMSKLVETYLSVARAENWSVDVHVAIKDDPKEERVRWEVEDRFDITAEEKVWTHDYRHMDRISNELIPVAIVFKGPHAAALLSSESGHHQRIESTDNHMVKVEFRNPTADATLVHPKDLELPGVRCRTIQKNKRQLEDHRLDLRFALEPRINLLYARFMRGAMYRTVFGASGAAWFRAWEQS